MIVFLMKIAIYTVFCSLHATSKSLSILERICIPERVFTPKGYFLFSYLNGY